MGAVLLVRAYGDYSHLDSFQGSFYLWPSHFREQVCLHLWASGTGFLVKRLLRIYIHRIAFYLCGESRLVTLLFLAPACRRFKGPLMAWAHYPPFQQRAFYQLAPFMNAGIS